MLIKPEADHRFHGPQLLPGGRTVLFTQRASDVTWDTAEIVAQSLDSGERKVLVDGGYDARYLPTGHLVYASNGGLFAVRFDARALTLIGTPVPMITGVAAATAGQTGASQFAVARDGTLIYVSGNIDNKRTYVWVDREGRETPTGAPPRAYAYARISPDGTKAAFDVRDSQNDIWVWDFERRTMSRLTFEATLNRSPVWSPDGIRIAYSTADENGTEGVYVQRADGSGSADVLLKRPREQWVPVSWSRDGHVLVTQTAAPWNLADVSIAGAHEFRKLLGAPHNDTNGEVSPDGRWLAYESNESGRTEIFVRPYPNLSGGKWQVSAQGGTRPAWAHSGRELFYFSNQGSLLVAQVHASATFAVATPTALPITGFIAPYSGRSYDVAPDDRRFLMLKNVDSERDKRATLHIVENWLEEVQQRLDR